MASTGNIKAGAAFVEVTADDSKLARGLRRAQARVRAFAAGMARIGGALVAAGGAMLAPMVIATRSFARFGDQVDKMSKRTGIAAPALSEIAFAAEQSGASLDDVEKAVRRMQRTVLDAKQGTKEAKDALDGLGLSLEQLAALAPEDQFALILERLKGIKDPTLRAATAMEIFGRSGTAMLPMVNDFAKLRQEARDLGITLTQKDTTAAADLTDAMNRVRRSVTAVNIAIGAALAPTLQNISERIIKIIGNVVQWVQQNRDMVVGFAMTAVKVAAAGAAFLALAVAAKVVAVLTGVVMGLVKAVHALAVAMTWLAAHPVVAALTAAVVVTLALGYAINKAAVYTAKFSDEMQRALEKGDALRRTDQLRMERLQQLAAKQKLTNAEQAEAARLIRELEGRYGDLGISINKATRTIEGMTAAQKKLNKAMRQRALDQLTAEIAEVQKNIDELVKEAESKAGFAHGFWRALLGDLNGPTRDIREINRQIEELTKKSAALLARRKQVTRDDKDAVTGGTPDKKPPEVKKRAERISAEEVARAEQGLASLRKRLSRERRTDLENEIQDIHNLGEEYKAVLKKIIAGEKAKKKVDQGRVTALEDELKGVGEHIEEMMDRAVKSAAGRAKRAIQDADAEIRAIMAGVTSGRREGRQGEAIRGLTAADPGKAVTVLRQILTAAQEAEAKAKRQLTDVWARVRADGKITEAERRELERAKKSFQKSSSETDRYRQFLDGAREALEGAAERVTTETRVSFSAAALFGFGASSASDRTANATEKAAGFLEKILRLAAGLGVIEVSA